MKIIKKIIILGIIFLLALCLVKGINGCFSCKQNEEQKWFNEYMSQHFGGFEGDIPDEDCDEDIDEGFGMRQ